MTTTLKRGDRVELLPGVDLGPTLLPGATGVVHEVYPNLRVPQPGMPTLHDDRNDFTASVLFFAVRNNRPEDFGPAPASVTNGLALHGKNMPISECVPVRISEVKVTGNIMLEGSNA